jgi:predicted nucleic acid-binding protein
MTNSFIDASILMELMFKRGKLQPVVMLLTAADKRFFTSALTVHLLYHFGQRASLNQETIAKVAAMAQVLPVDEATIKNAQRKYRGKDFEDCLQAACAEIGGCDEIVTLDKHFLRDSGTKLAVSVL